MAHHIEKSPVFVVEMIGFIVFACCRLWHERVIVWAEWMGLGELQA